MRNIHNERANYFCALPVCVCVCGQMQMYNTCRHAQAARTKTMTHAAIVKEKKTLQTAPKSMLWHWQATYLSLAASIDMQAGSV